MNEKSKFKKTKHFTKFYKELAGLATCVALSFANTGDFCLKCFSAEFNGILQNFRSSESTCVGNVCVYQKSSAQPGKDPIRPLLHSQCCKSAE